VGVYGQDKTVTAHIPVLALARNRVRACVKNRLSAPGNYIAGF
jgi:hypothetical protein